MAITKSASLIAPGFGTPTTVASNTAALVASATTTVTLTSPATVSSGYVHVKFSGPAVSTTAQFAITVTDGTTTYLLLGTTTATAAGQSAAILLPFILDINANAFSVVTTLAGAATTGTLDIEVVGNP